MQQLFFSWADTDKESYGKINFAEQTYLNKESQKTETVMKQKLIIIDIKKEV